VTAVGNGSLRGELGVEAGVGIGRGGETLMLAMGLVLLGPLLLLLLLVLLMQLGRRRIGTVGWLLVLGGVIVSADALAARKGSVVPSSNVVERCNRVDLGC
jgi:hypothetical protein